jgi:3-hydroxybutyryl-CoA dehydrogenase
MRERLGIVGSGTIASGLAKVAVEHGDVVLMARSDASAERARAQAPGCRIVTDLAELAEATFLVECVAEDAEVKAGVLAELASVAAPGAVLATTTSSLPLAPLAAATGRPERFCAFHVFNPVPKMALVELAYLPEAADDVRARARELCEHLGKTPVEVAPEAGFVVNRLLFPYLFSAVSLAEETGMPPGDVDACMKLGAGHPLGPLALLDLVGLDVALAIGDAIGLDVPGRVRSLVAEGALGRKAGRGLHLYE